MRVRFLLWSLMCLVLMPGVAGAEDPFNGSTVTRLFDTDDASAAAPFDFKGFGTIRPLAVDSAGNVFLLFFEAPEAMFQQIVRYSEDGAGGSTVESVYRLDGVDDPANGWARLIMGMVVVPVDTFDDLGDPVLVKDRLALVVDGFDPVTETPWRELQMIDPNSVADPVLLYRDEPGGGNQGPLSIFTNLYFAVDDFGVFYTLDEGSDDPTVPLDVGNIHSIAFDSVSGEFVDTAIMTDGSALRNLTTRGNGLLYAEDTTGDMIEIDPTGTDLVSSFGVSGIFAGFTFDSNDRGWVDGPGKGKKLTGMVTEFFEGQSVSKDDRISGSTNRHWRRSITSDTAGAVYILEIEQDNDPPAGDLVAVWKIEPAGASEPPPPPPSGTSSVVAVTYSPSGGPSGDKNIKVTVIVEDDTGAALADATVDFTVTLDDVTFDTFSAATNSAGAATVNIRNAPSGTYETTVDDVVATGFTFDGDTPPNSFTKP